VLGQRLRLVARGGEIVIREPWNGGYSFAGSMRDAISFAKGCHGDTHFADYLLESFSECNPGVTPEFYRFSRYRVSI